ncbi:MULTISPECIES: hypothetical protein [unclassified Streptomyces]|uniref:hypothetical protein n=1 Tax=unclassified Streptomyces TaxID=2593676 RepID=UPI0006FC2F39|nr:MULTISPECIES: hypothetical protein [unclassified Streptomyces]KQX49506.1 hypothetical protein ASD33_17365 [Streptomyces sp. Root1304]KRA79125.1 hypothetical protein ASE09_21885 [Streptomyces sp. Root66D1]
MRQGDEDRAERASEGGRSRRLLRRFSRHRGAPAPAGTAPEATPSTDAGAPGTAASPAPHTVRDDFPHRHLLRSSAAPDSPVRALVQALPADPRRPVVVVDVPQSAAGNLGEELGALLARLREDEPLSLRLVLSGAAAPAGEDGPLAQRLADAWDMTLEAPDAPAVLAPGGLLHVTEPATPGGGWWRFVPGEAPEPLGTRLPAPRWQRALARVPLGPVGAGVVRAVPAGLALGPADAAAPRPDGPAYAVAVDPERPAVLLGAPRADPVTAEDLATLLASLPSEIRRSLRLVPVDGRDATALAEEVCDLLGTELEVTLGLPLAAETEEAEPGEDAEEEAEGQESGRTAASSVRLISPEGEFTWPAPLASLLCSPTGDDGSRPAPRPTAWHLPASAGTPGAVPATLRLPSGAWAVAVRSGLWIGAADVPPSAVRDRAGEARALRVEVAAECLAEESVREATLRDLSSLLATLEPAARTHAELAVSEETTPEAAAALRRFAVRTGLPLAAPPRTTIDPEPDPEPEPTPEPEPEPNREPEPEQEPEPARESEPRPEPPAPAPPKPAAPEPAPAPPLPAPSAPSAPPTAVRRAPEEFSGEADRRAFRELAAAVWEEHSGPVGQALIRMPALRGSGEDAVRADLIAVRLYLSSAPEDPFGARALAGGAEELRPYAACLASGLRRLPALRGTLVRSVAQPSVPDEVVPGAVLVCDAPLDVVHLEAPDAPVPPLSHVRYAVRPMTARRTSVLSRDGSGAQALFAAGTAFAVVARHEADGELPARVLLAELPADAGRFREPSPEALERLDAAARRSGTAPWPARCTGPFLHAPQAL